MKISVCSGYGQHLQGGLVMVDRVMMMVVVGPGSANNLAQIRIGV